MRNQSFRILPRDSALYLIQSMLQIGTLSLPLLITALLLGCSGDSSSGLNPVDIPSAQQRAGSTNETDRELVAANDVSGGLAADDQPVNDVETDTIASANDVAVVTPSTPNWDSGYYKRDYDFPAMVTLPLQFITTSSGKKLAAMVTLPADDNRNPVAAKFPVVLVQAGYNIHLMNAALREIPGMSILGAPDQWMVRHGYAQVSVDVIGTGASQGGWEMFGEAEQIAYGDTVDWVLQQPWSNGNIGVAGVSYMGISALFTAERRPEAVKAVFAMLPIGDAMRGIVGTGGLINGLFMSLWARFTHALSLQNYGPVLMYPEYRDHFRAVNQEHVDQIDNFFLPLVDDALGGAPYLTYDSEFWRTRSTLEHVADIRAPTFITGALHDIFQRDEPLLYEQLKKTSTPVW